MRRKKEREDMIKSMQAAAKKPESQQRKALASSNGPTVGNRTANGQSSNSTRLNEPLPTGRRRTGASRRSTRGTTGAGASGRKFLVDHADREAWVSFVLYYLFINLSIKL